MANLNDIAQSLRHDEQGWLPCPLKQSISGDRGAHFDRVNRTFGNAFPICQAKKLTNAMHRCVSVIVRIMREIFARAQITTRLAGDNIGERPASINPELPACHP